jgi:hypothetical protein
VWQAKNHAAFGPADMDAAVKVFLDGKWAKPKTRFVIATRCTLSSTQINDRIEHWKTELAKVGIEFDAFDGEKLSIDLKKKPEVVQDFFGNNWLKRFCGDEAASALA